MPSPLHQALIQIFQYEPSLAAALLTDALGQRLPPHKHVRLEPGELTDLVPTEYRADVVVALADATRTVLAVVVEVQLGKDDDKRWTWPVYLTTLRARLRCPVVLLAVCVNARIARWSARPIDLGHPGWTLRPLVLGPDRVPFVTDATQAEDAPELAALSAMAHATHPDWNKIAAALLAALDNLDDQERADRYTDVVLAALPDAARATLEAMMTTQTSEFPISETYRRWRREAQAEGRLEGRLEGRRQGR